MSSFRTLILVKASKKNKDAVIDLIKEVTGNNKYVAAARYRDGGQVQEVEEYGFGAFENEQNAFDLIHKRFVDLGCKMKVEEN